MIKNLEKQCCNLKIPHTHNCIIFNTDFYTWLWILSKNLNIFDREYKLFITFRTSFNHIFCKYIYLYSQIESESFNYYVGHTQFPITRVICREDLISGVPAYCYTWTSVGFNFKANSAVASLSPFKKREVIPMFLKNSNL